MSPTRQAETRGGRRRGDADARRRNRHRARRRAVRTPQARPEVADQFTAHVIWMSADPMLPGRSYLLKIGARTVAGARSPTSSTASTSTRQEKLAAKTLALNEVGFCNLATTMPVAFDPYADNHDTGAFILIDRAHQRDGGGGHDRARAAARDQRASPRLHGRRARRMRR